MPAARSGTCSRPGAHDRRRRLATAVAAAAAAAAVISASAAAGEVAVVVGDGVAAAVVQLLLVLLLPSDVLLQVAAARHRAAVGPALACVDLQQRPDAAADVAAAGDAQRARRAVAQQRLHLAAVAVRAVRLRAPARVHQQRHVELNTVRALPPHLLRRVRLPRAHGHRRQLVRVPAVLRTAIRPGHPTGRTTNRATASERARER
jgi:hypothetical protein